MVTPSRLGEWDTSGHDELLLWISEHPEILIEFVTKVSGIYRHHRSGSSKQAYELVQGYPIVSNNGYLYGKIDTIIKTHTEYRVSSSKKTVNVLKDVMILIIDAKPRLDRISATLDQINAYARLLDFDKDYKDIEIQKRMKVIVTFDQNGRFDAMLVKQRIYVFHIQL